MIKAVPRGISATADAYLTPILREYLDGFFNGFDEGLKRGSGVEGGEEGKEGRGGARVEFMSSDGGLVDAKNFSGLKSILSGPAGGVVGYALTSWDEETKTPVIGYVHLTSPLRPSSSTEYLKSLVSVPVVHRRWLLIAHFPATVDSTSVAPQQTSPVSPVGTK